MAINPRIQRVICFKEIVFQDNKCKEIFDNKEFSKFIRWNYFFFQDLIGIQN